MVPFTQRSGHLARTAALAASIALAASVAPHVHADPPADRNDAPAQQYRGDVSVRPNPDGNIIAEAEEFTVQDPHGWQSLPWGENYYAATFANTFLSRKAFLGAPATVDEPAVASIAVTVPEAGNYLVLARYEAAYRFETQFTIQIEQNGQTVFDRTYGARDNVKVWAFGERLKKEVAWYWGAVENVVWEGHDAFAELEPGQATIRLIAGPQEGDAARRNVDLVMLTTDVAQVLERIEKENYLPLDGMLTQADDVFLRVHNQGASPVTVTVPTGREHSPYWVHMRDWPATQTVEAQPGQTSDWLEVGKQLDSLNDGQWDLAAKGEGLDYTIEIGLKNAQGEIESLRKFQGNGPSLPLVYHGDTRYSRQVRHADEVLFDLLAYLRENEPDHGAKPQRVVIHGYTFTKREGDEAYNRGVDEFMAMFNLTNLITDVGTLSNIATDAGTVENPRGYIDVRSTEGEALEKELQEYVDKGVARQIHTVSMGDEIGLPAPAADDHEGFRQWAQERGLSPQDVNPDAQTWDGVQYLPQAEEDQPRAYYYATLYRYDYGIDQLRQKTNVVRKYLPNAGIGANYSPHHAGHAYIGQTHMWIRMFREEGMTMPWSEDYIWQLPMGTQQMNFIGLDMFRAAVKDHPEQRIQYYVMPHWPGNTPNSWRRQFYGDVAHGMQVVNLFEFRPVQAAYTENHVSLPEMFSTVREAFHEMGQFEDIMLDGRVRQGSVAMYFSDAGDAWHNLRTPFAAGKRSLYIALQHLQLPLDFVIEEDVLDDTLGQYEVLYLTDQNVSRQASEAIAQWVEQGGKLFATAGAGMFDEFNEPNAVMRELLGVEQSALHAPENSAVRYIKEDLPFAEAIGTVTLDSGGEMPIFGAKSDVQANSAYVIATFADGSPAVTRKGEVTYTAFLPGLSYFHPAIPRRPVDRGSSDDAMAHLIPTEFDQAALDLIGQVAQDVERPVVTSEPLVAAKLVEAESGTLIPLVNWSDGPIQGLQVTLNIDAPANAELASGKPVQVSEEDGKRVFTLDLDVADAIILR